MSSLGSFDPTKVAALIPSYLEAEHIEDVVTRARAHLRDVIVVDDGSSDNTGALAAKAGAEVITHPKNAGKGAAIKTGFRELMARGFDYVLIFDGDGQHLPEEIGNFLKAGAADPTARIVIGNRMADTKGMPPVRLMTNRFMSWQISRLCRQQIPDTQCGFRMIHREVIPSLLECVSNAYDYETEMLLLVSRAGHRVISVPVTTVYADEKSKIQPLRDGIRFVRLLSRYS